MFYIFVEQKYPIVVRPETLIHKSLIAFEDACCTQPRDSVLSVVYKAFGSKILPKQI